MLFPQTRDVVLEERRRLLRDERTINMAFVGLPNAGKSSLVNALLKEERIITDTTPGETNMLSALLQAIY